MGKFFKTHYNTIINVDSIQLIKMIKYKDCFEKKPSSKRKDEYILTEIGKKIFNTKSNSPLYGLDDPVSIPFILNLSIRYSVKDKDTFFLPFTSDTNSQEKLSNYIVAYMIYLDRSMIEDSETVLYLYPKEYDNLTKLLDVSWKIDGEIFKVRKKSFGKNSFEKNNSRKNSWKNLRKMKKPKLWKPMV